MIENSLTPLSRLLTSLRSAGEGFDIDVPEDWLQGRAIYGGLSTTFCLAAIRARYNDLPPLRSAQIAFVGPAGPQVHVRPSLLRRGKSTVFIAADVVSDGDVASRATFCFGGRRDSTLAHSGPPAPKMAGPQASGRFFEDAQGRNQGPNFARHFDSRRADKSLPMSASDDPEFLVWMRHRDQAINPVIVGLIALGDALPPAAMASMKRPAPVSSMTWQLDLLTDSPNTRDGWWLCRSRADQIGDGYSGQSMMIWNADGEPVIAGRQSVAVFA